MLGLIRSRSAVYVTAIFTTLVFSVWSYFKTAVMNPDAICYLQSAETMKMGLSAAMHLCDQAKWPLFSGLIYLLSQATHLSILHSAYVLDGFFSFISVVTFIAIVQHFKVPTRVLWFAALTILLAHEFNTLREDVIRDHGFWAFYLVSIFMLLTFFQHPKWRTAIAWSISLVIATLFRIEGLVFLLLVPFAAWFRTEQKFKSFLQLNTILFVAFAALIFLLMKQGVDHLGRVDEVKFQVLNGLDLVVQNFNTKAAALGQHVLSVYSLGDAKSILVLLLLSWYLFSVASNLSYIYSILVVYAWARKKLISSPVLWTYVLTNVLITSIFLIENMFLSKRYLIALVLTLMIWVPFALEDLLKQWKERRWPFALAIFLVLASGIGGIFHFGPSKFYIRQAGEWLATNMPEKASLYSNDYQVMYYSHQFGNQIFQLSPQYMNLQTIANQRWKQYDFVAIRFNKNDIEKNAAFINEMKLTPVQVFSNKRGDQVSIYQIPHRR